MQRPIAFETFLSSATASSDFGTIFATVGFKTLEDLLLWYSLPWSCFRLSIAFPVHPSSMFQFEQHHWLHVPKVMGFHLCRNSIYLSTSNPSKLCLHLRFSFPVSKYLIHHMCFPLFLFQPALTVASWFFQSQSPRKLSRSPLLIGVDGEDWSRILPPSSNWRSGHRRGL